MNLDYLSKEFYLGGYYIIRSIVRADYMNKNVLHEVILSASRCICDFYPDIDYI
jgi:hypothetical protein